MRKADAPSALRVGTTAAVLRHARLALTDCRTPEIYGASADRRCNSLLVESVMTYRHPAQTNQFVHTLLLSGMALFTSGVMHRAWSQHTPVPLGCRMDQGDPQGTNGRDLSGYMFFAPRQLPTATRPGRPPIVRTPPTGSVGIVRPPPPGMSTAMCTSECGNRGFFFAGTQYGSYCFCGHQYGRSGLSTDCKMPCSGNAGEICGGAWANSVYWTGVTAPPAQGWTGAASCQVDVRGPSYLDSRKHTWTLIGPPAPVSGGEVYRAVWSVAGSGSKSTTTGSAQWNVLGGSGLPIKVWIRIADGKRVISPDTSQLSIPGGISGTQQLVGQNPGPIGAQAFEYDRPQINALASATVINGTSTGPTTGAPGYMQPGTAQGTYTCSWNFQKR